VLVQIDALIRQQDALTLPITIRNLGFGGAGVDIADPTLLPATQAGSATFALAVNAPVVIELVAPVLWDPLHLPGRVAWSRQNAAGTRPARIGIRFEPLDGTTLLSLFDVLGSL